MKHLPKQQKSIKATIVDERTLANNLNFEAVQQFSKDFGVPASVIYTTYAGFKSIVNLAN
jgi:vancomycin permeability regulator SanA